MIEKEGPSEAWQHWYSSDLVLNFLHVINYVCMLENKQWKIQCLAKVTEGSRKEERGWGGYRKMNGHENKCMQARAVRPPLYTAPLPWHQNRRGKHLLFVEKPNLICTFQRGVNIFELSRWAHGGPIRFSRETAPSRISSLLHHNFTF